MAIQHSAVITFADCVGKRTTCKVSDVNDLTTAKSLASALAGWTYAEAWAATHSEKDPEKQGAATVHEGFDSVNVKAQMFFEDANTGDQIRIELPCPSVTLFEHGQRNTYTVIKAKGDAIALDLKVATGKEVRFVSGRLIGNTTKPQ